MFELTRIVCGCLAAALLTVVAAAGIASADITGSVFRDFDADGTRDSLEPGAGGVSVSAFDAGGAMVSTTTAFDGTYTLVVPAGTEVRVEASATFPSLYPGAVGTDSDSSVVFATSPATADFAVASPAQYCQLNPDVSISKYINGNPLGGGSSGTSAALLRFPYTRTGAPDVPPVGGYVAPTALATNAQIGATWGLAWQRSSSSLFLSAVMKRHVGFGPLGPSGLYRVDLSGAPAVSSFVDLNALGFGAGADPHSGLTVTANQPNHDPNAWDPVGKISLGGL
ncbi:MAG TPA: hypothetical protein VEB21_18855, partial [Terriglobales bacterium]|nr:hypothetical protein [Terriglobales bacterium]